jgi:hypothetical protein
MTVTFPAAARSRAATRSPRSTSGRAAGAASGGMALTCTPEPDRKGTVLLADASQHPVSVRAPASAGEYRSRHGVLRAIHHKEHVGSGGKWNRSPTGYPGDHQILAMWAHPDSLNYGRMDAALYAIRINGHLGATLLSAFPAMVTQQQGPVTVLTGILDQSALYGVLAEIETLGLDLLEVRQLTPGPESPEPGEYLSP